MLGTVADRAAHMITGIKELLDSDASNVSVSASDEN